MTSLTGRQQCALLSARSALGPLHIGDLINTLSDFDVDEAKHFIFALISHLELMVNFKTLSLLTKNYM